MKQLRNLVRTLSDKSKQCRFSPKTAQFAYGLWAESPSQYRASKAILPLIIPGERQLKRIKARNKCEDGEDIKTYQMLGSTKKPEEILHAILYCSEMKLKNGVLWNSMTGKFTGLAKDILDPRSVLKRVLS